MGPTTCRRTGGTAPGPRPKGTTCRTRLRYACHVRTRGWALTVVLSNRRPSSLCTQRRVRGSRDHCGCGWRPQSDRICRRTGRWEDRIPVATCDDPGRASDSPSPRGGCGGPRATGGGVYCEQKNPSKTGRDAPDTRDYPLPGLGGRERTRWGADRETLHTVCVTRQSRGLRPPCRGRWSHCHCHPSRRRRGP